MAPAAQTTTVIAQSATANPSGVAVFTSFANDPIGEYRGTVVGVILFGVASLWMAAM